MAWHTIKYKKIPKISRNLYNTNRRWILFTIYVYAVYNIFFSFQIEKLKNYKDTIYAKTIYFFSFQAVPHSDRSMFQFYTLSSSFFFSFSILTVTTIYIYTLLIFKIFIFLIFLMFILYYFIFIFQRLFFIFRSVYVLNGETMTSAIPGCVRDREIETSHLFFFSSSFSFSLPRLKYITASAPDAPADGSLGCNDPRSTKLGHPRLFCDVVSTRVYTVTPFSSYGDAPTTASRPKAEYSFRFSSSAFYY